MINVKEYTEKKAKKLATLAKIGDSYAVAIKQFDPDTGEEKEAEIQAVGLDQLQTRRQELVDEIADIDAMIADIDAIATLSKTK